VGDRISRDISGARRAGFCLAIQIRHDFEHGERDDGLTPDAVIDNLTDLLGILKAHHHRASQADYQERRSASQLDPAGSRKIRALLFDAGDVLYYRLNSGHKLTSFLSQLNLDPDQAPLAEKKALETQAYRGQILQEEYREAMLRLYGVSQPEHIEHGKRLMEQEENNVQFFEGVKETLRALKDQGFLLGIITDTAQPIHVKLDWFEKAGFGDVWDSIISSQELGVRKPEPEIYHASLQQLGLSPDQAAFVGHKASELEGAKAVGMHTIAFNYDHAAQADYYIDRFADLLTIPLVRVAELEAS
jgi:HAD superfamily hydrolase (TIGR01509 family)